ncbi:hypothetical protein EDC26_10289 [Paralcaligenes ureilyticus]|uniref:Uncharacterized protein n=1 Tax=Paralcaligenes ureilyticus TaxID=627131 RepID=A0A4R3MBK3_9BURK|nr:hypothetical protein EDC26_10289 [Paralcaligenes ureilyticus]
MQCPGIKTAVLLMLINYRSFHQDSMTMHVVQSTFKALAALACHRGKSQWELKSFFSWRGSSWLII